MCVFEAVTVDSILVSLRIATRQKISNAPVVVGWEVTSWPRVAHALMAARKREPLFNIKNINN